MSEGSTVLDQMTEPPPVFGNVTIFRGSSFCLGAPNGDIDSRLPQGWFLEDIRMLSRLRILVDDAPLEVLAVNTAPGSVATFLCREAPAVGTSESVLLVERRRSVDDVRGVMLERLVLRNLSAESRVVNVAVELDADFAGIFAVKEGRVIDAAERRSITVVGQNLEIASNGYQVHAEISGPATVSASDDGFLRASLELAGRARTQLSLEFKAVPAPAGTAFLIEDERVSARPLLHIDDELLQGTFQRSVRDLASLRITDPEEPADYATAAGAPWFMTLFGRDSLLTSLMALPLDSGLARGTLRMLARRQGKVIDEASEEQPGRILHETRGSRDAALLLGGRNTYYGSVDAPLLFVIALGEFWRWTGDAETVRQLLPNADAALAWAADYGDADGDGFVEYIRKSATGLTHQGWKDSWNGITYADGRVAQAPIALCEVQGYWYAALQARADIAEGFGHRQNAESLRRQANDLKDRFNDTFWLGDFGRYALALSDDHKPVDSVASNLGHLLWTGIVPVERSSQIADSLLSPQMASGWGLRTLGMSMGAYNPLSYHNGSVWPHDTAIAIAGLARYGLTTHCLLLARSLLDAAECFDGRLPELFSGMARDEFPQPVAYPTSCSPQAWAAASPLLVMRALLGFEPDVPRGIVRVNSAVPPDMQPLSVSGLRLGRSLFSISVQDNHVSTAGLPRGVRVITESLWGNGEGAGGE
jgi:glycogen debranching enzyme